jgi:hypothetical protein
MEEERARGVAEGGALVSRLRMGRPPALGARTLRHRLEKEEEPIATARCGGGAGFTCGAGWQRRSGQRPERRGGVWAQLPK